MRIMKSNNVTFSRLVSMPPAIWMIVIMVVFFGINTKNYFTINNFTNIVIQAIPLFIVACGQTMVILIQDTDLSMGASLNMVMVLWILMMKAEINTFTAMGVAIFAAVLAGFLNGVIVAKLKIPSFIATLGTQNIMNAIALTLSNGSSVFCKKDIYKAVIGDRIVGIPIILWVAIGCFLLSWVMLNKMKFGSRIIALGGNEEALNVAGYSVIKAKIQVYIFAGLMAGIAGIMLACRIESGNPNAGDGFEFNSMAAVLLGGTSMTEGRGGITGTIWGVLLIQILKYSLVIMNISSIYQTAIIGIVVLLAVIIDATVKHRQEQIASSIER